MINYDFPAMRNWELERLPSQTESEIKILERQGPLPWNHPLKARKGAIKAEFAKREGGTLLV